MTGPRRARLVPLAAVAILLGACTSPAPFGGAEWEDVGGLLQRAGLTICEGGTHEVAGGQANQAETSVTFDVALDCSSDDRALVTVDQFGNADDRDAAVRTFNEHLTRTGNGAVWTWGTTTIFVSGTADDAVFERIANAFDTGDAA